MKKPILIISGIIIILLIVVVWVYLFMFGAPENGEDIFANFGSGSPSVFEPSSSQNGGSNDTASRKALRQLTTRPVAGAVFIGERVRYMERGTGHLYEIQLLSGNETLLSGTTLPRTTDAIFNETGERVLITYDTEAGIQTVLGTYVSDSSGGKIETLQLPPRAREAAFTVENTISYIEPTDIGTVGVQYHIGTGQTSVLFSIPLRDIQIVWGTDTYVYTTPSGAQIGHLYRITNGSLGYVAPGGVGLMAFPALYGIGMTKITESSLTSSHVSAAETRPLPLSLFPQKCTEEPVGGHLICAAPFKMPEALYPDDWYKGIVSFSDGLWKINITSGEGALLSDFEVESGREVDVSKIGVSANGDYIYFINKNDGTLWMYDTSVRGD